jgi:hypothetical protein
LAAHAVAAVARVEIRGEGVLFEVGDVFVAESVDVAALAPVAAVRPAVGNKLFAAKSRGTLASVAGFL